MKFWTHKPAKSMKSNTEKSRQYRQAHPIRAAYLNLKHNARRRGKEFLLSWEEFTEFCRPITLHYGAKRHKETFSIDRIDPRKGYSADNIQLLTLRENTLKQHSDRRIFQFSDDYQEARIKPAAVYNYENSPF